MHYPPYKNNKKKTKLIPKKTTAENILKRKKKKKQWMNLLRRKNALIKKWCSWKSNAKWKNVKRMNIKFWMIIIIKHKFFAIKKFGFNDIIYSKISNEKNIMCEKFYNNV